MKCLQFLKVIEQFCVRLPGKIRTLALHGLLWISALENQINMAHKRNHQKPHVLIRPLEAYPVVHAM